MEKVEKINLNSDYMHIPYQLAKLINTFIEAGFIYSAPKYNVHKDVYLEYLDNIKKEFKTVDEVKPAVIDTKRMEYIDICNFYQSEDFVLVGMYSDNYINIYIYFRSIESYVINTRKLKDLMPINVRTNYDKTLHYISNDGSLEASTLNIDTRDCIKLSHKWLPYLNIDRLFYAYTNSNSNLLIVTGEPGIGKSKLSAMYIEYLLKYRYSIGSTSTLDVSSIQDERVLLSSKFWTDITLTTYPPDLIIIDDVDSYITSSGKYIKDEERTLALTNLLKFLDGESTIKPKTKVIITTNKPITSLDPALIRKGRTFDILNFRALTSSEALDIWKENKLSKKDFDKHFGSNVKYVTHAELAFGIEEVRYEKEKDNVGYTYVNEKNISLYNHYKDKIDDKSDKLGFKFD